MVRRVRRQSIVYIPDANPPSFIALAAWISAGLATVGLLLGLWLLYDNEPQQSGARESPLATSSAAEPIESTSGSEVQATPSARESSSDTFKSSRAIDPNDIATVLSVTDGDTFRASVRGRNEPVRLIGIDAPETRHPTIAKQCFGAEASRRLERMLTGKTVFLVRDGLQDDRDRYGRLLRFVFLKNKSNVNEALVRGGFATYEEQYPIAEPFRTELEDAESAAVDRGAGLWRACR